MTWKEFEDACLAHLKNAYSTQNISFSSFGGSDSTKADIKVTLSTGTSFFIEAKKQNAQSGQFVVLKDEDGFYFSPKNADHENPYSQQIIDYMNSYGDMYTDPGTDGVIIPLPQSIAVSWIVKHYQNKSVKFVISSNNSKDFILLPLNKLGEYFTVTARYRIKRSGSSVPSPNNFDEIRSLINDSRATLVYKEGVLVVHSNTLTNTQQLKGHSYSYQFNQIDARGTDFAVRRLSNTTNPNVIFSLKLIKEQGNEDLEEFEGALR